MMGFILPQVHPGQCWSLGNREKNIELQFNFVLRGGGGGLGLLLWFYAVILIHIVDVNSFRSPAVIDHVDGSSRPKTAEPRHSQPIWLGGSGPERVHSPGKRFINQGSGVAPYAYHEGSPG